MHTVPASSNLRGTSIRDEFRDRPSRIILKILEKDKVVVPFPINSYGEVIEAITTESQSGTFRQLRNRTHFFSITNTNYNRDRPDAMR